MLNYPKETPPAALLNYPEIPARAAHLYPFPTQRLVTLPSGCLDSVICAPVVSRRRARSYSRSRLPERRSKDIA